MYDRKWWQFKRYKYVRLRVPADRALEFVSFFLMFFLFVSVDSCADFSQFQGLFSSVEPRRKANCQLQLGHYHQDLGIAIWRLQVDPDRPLEHVRFFFKSFCVSLFLMIRVLTSHNHRVTSVAWSKDDKLASGSFDTTVKIWSVGSTGTFECQSTLTGHSDLYVFFPLFFSSSVSLSFSVDLCLDFLQFQSLVCGVEPRWKTNCQRQ